MAPGIVAANQYHAGKVVDPRPYAVGSIKKTFEKFPHLGKLLPAMGYSETQRHELQETIKRVPCDVVLVATPIDLARTIHIDKPSVRVRYEVEEIGKPADPSAHRKTSPSSISAFWPAQGGSDALERLCFAA